MDLLIIAITVAFFAATVLYVGACDRMGKAK
jgi:hypothetical protein